MDDDGNYCNLGNPNDEIGEEIKKLFDEDKYIDVEVIDVSFTKPCGSQYNESQVVGFKLSKDD